MSGGTVEAARPPAVRGLPLLGNLPGLANDPAAFLVRCYREYGPVFRIRVLNRNVTVLAGPDLARFMGSREGRTALRSKEVWQGLVDEYGARTSVLGADGAEHRRLRDLMRRGYSREALAGRMGDLVGITDQCLDQGWPAGGRVPVVEALQRLVVTQLGTLLTGRVPLDYVEDIRTTILTILNVHVVKQRPAVMLRLPRYQRAKARVVELSDLMIAEHAARPPHAAHERTLVDDLMDAHADDPDLLSRNELVVALTGPYVAGLDTVANTLGGLVYLVLKHPDVLRRIRAESDEAFGAGPVGDDLVERLPATHGAVQEAMRLYPIAVAQPRVANRDFEYAGHTVLEGEDVYCAITVPHFLEEFFPDPGRFDIDRYTDERREHARPGAYAPFGKGPHTCLGKGIADVQMTVTAARLFHRLELALDPPDYTLRRKAVPTPGPASSFRVRVAGHRSS
ncbi:MAG: cytochrome P450 [Actinobacteria bacterium]|nr:cytochrome P450 [Actinomycetota bacterium]